MLHPSRLAHFATPPAPLPYGQGHQPPSAAVAAPAPGLPPPPPHLQQHHAPHGPPGHMPPVLGGPPPPQHLAPAGPPRDPRDTRPRSEQERQWEMQRERDFHQQQQQHHAPPPHHMMHPSHAPAASPPPHMMAPPPHHAMHHAPPHSVHGPPPPHHHGGYMPPPPQQPHAHPHAHSGGMPPPPPHAAVAARPGSLPLPPVPSTGLPMPPPPGAPVMTRALPPPPPPEALRGAGSAPPDAWRIYKTAPPESREYFFNCITARAQWLRPVELVPLHERELPPCEWTEHKTPDGISYFAHRESGVSVWMRPPELIAYEEAKRARDDALALWLKDHPPAAVEPPPQDEVTELTRSLDFSKQPDPLSSAKGKKGKKGAPATAAAVPSSEPEEGEIEPSGGGATATEGKSSAPEEGEVSGATAAGADGAPAAAAAADDPVYATKEEARAAFRALLVDKRISTRMKNFATDVQPLLSDDPRYRALKTLPERKKAWLQYMEELVRAEHEARRQREAGVLEAFNQLLVETVEIDAKSRYRTSLPLLEGDERFRALHALYLTERVTAGSTDARLNNEAVHQKLEGLFYKHVDALLEKSKLAAAARRLAQAEAFRQLLREHTELSALEANAPENKTNGAQATAEEKEEGEEEEGAVADPSAASARPAAPRWINSSTSWRSLKKRAELTSDPRWMEGPSEADAFELFEDWMLALDKIARDKEQAAKEARRQIEKDRRREFRQLLSELAAQARLHARSRWKEVLPLVESDARYRALLSLYETKEKDASRAMERVKDLTADFVAELAERHEPIKKMLKGTVLKDIHLTVLPTHTPEQLLSFCASLHPRWAELTKGLAQGDLQAVCAELIAKQALKETYFHAKQKAEQVRLVGRMLRTLYPEPSQAEPLTLEAIKAQVAELQQPVPAPVEAKEAEEEEPEEGAIEEGELPDEEAEPAPPKMVPRKLPPAVSEGLAAWSLLECPPIPPPGADPTAPPPATPQPPYSTDEYIREALEAFKAQRRKEADSTGADSTAMSDERKEGSSTAAAAGSKRRRSRSRSASPAAPRSKQRREEPADEKASAASSSATAATASATAATAASFTPAAAMEDAEEGEQPDE